jgi:putative DNA primase/helicase
MIQLQSLARALGGTVTGKSVLCPGPGHSTKDRSLSVTPSSSDPDGFICNSHAGDGWRECKDYVRGRLGTAPTFQPATRSKPQQHQADDDGAARAREIWGEAKDAHGTIVETYLASRGLALPECGNYALRFHPACPWERGRMPAMVAAFRSIANDRIVTGIHRTALTADGQKIDRKMLGRAKDAAIMLDPSADVTAGLAIAEGIESGLAGRVLGWRPCWALGSAGAIGRFPVLAGIECLNVLAELDDSGANARAIDEVGKRWLSADREVLVIAPKHGGDMNDALRRCA